MARIRSLIVQVQIDRAGKAHSCQANAQHRLEKGDLRLKVRNGRSWDHYCLTCAEVIIERDIQKLTGLRRFQVDVSPPLGIQSALRGDLGGERDMLDT
jgi:hypothetical protein